LTKGGARIEHGKNAARGLEAVSEPVGQAFQPDRLAENVRLESLTYGFATAS
jgi:hypothetical protein